MSSGCGRIGFENQSQASPDGSPDEVDASVGNQVPESVFSIAAGEFHSCATKGGRLYCWGDQQDVGLLGTGQLSGQALAAKRIGLGADWVDVRVGTRHTCAARLDGSVWCWGGNGSFVTGDTGLAKTSPQQVQGVVAKTLVTRFDHACAITAESVLLCWGANAENQLGLGEGNAAVDRATPIAPIGEVATWHSVASGQGHSCAIATDRSLWCWGRNTQSQSGLGPSAPGQLSSPRLVDDTESWEQVSAGQGLSCGITPDGRLWCWGEGESGQLGIAGTTSVTVPTQVGSDSNWVQVSTNTFSTCAIKNSGSLWCWGRGIEGQLGIGSNIAMQETPVQAGSASWQSVSVGRFHVCAANTDGDIWCTGANDSGQLGQGDTSRQSVLTLVDLPAP